MHVYAHLFDEGTLGQITLRSPRLLRPRTSPLLRSRLPQLYHPLTTITPCPGRISWSTDHTHFILLPGQLAPPVIGSGYGGETLYGTATIARADVDAGVALNYRTTVNNDHSHVLSLTAGELAGLRAGKTLTKETSRDARPGGRQHAHTVTLSCFHEVNQYALTPPNYVSGY